ncbi:MAG: hypothetical protein MI717_14865 [Spirochaetales bacterium]|nr:hypothetical protein [Spirochaetales bacterium]
MNKLKFVNIALIILAVATLSGCDLINGVLSPNKLAGNWYGNESDENGLISAELTITEGGSFKAVFNQNGERLTIKGSYSHTPQKKFLFSKDEYGAVIFKWETNTVPCQYTVTASSLQLANWVSRDGEGPRTLLLFR